MNRINTILLGTATCFAFLIMCWGIPIPALKLISITFVVVCYGVFFLLRLGTADDRVEPKKVAAVYWMFLSWYGGFLLVLWALWVTNLFPYPILYEIEVKLAFALLFSTGVYGIYRKVVRSGDQSVLLSNLLALHFDFTRAHQDVDRPIEDVLVFFFQGEKGKQLAVRSAPLTGIEPYWVESGSMCFYDEPLWLLLITYKGTTERQWHISDLTDTNTWKVTRDHRAILDTGSGSVACYAWEGEVPREQFAHDVLLFALLHRTWGEFFLRMCLRHAMDKIKESRSIAKIQKLDDLRNALGHADFTMFGAGECLQILKVWKLPPEYDELFEDSKSAHGDDVLLEEVQPPTAGK